MNEAMLRPDCAHCAALCCVALAFDRSELFAFDKPAGEACGHLGADLRCKIHDERARRGFGGCVRYDCVGAGQRVTQMFGGRDWRDAPALAVQMFEAFSLMRKVHDLLQLLCTAEKLPLTPEQSGARAALEQALLPADGWNLTALRAFDQGTLPHKVGAFLDTLKDHVRV